MKKILISIITFTLSFSIAFSQEANDNKISNGFLDYMQGRSTIGFNFMPSLNALGINLALDSLLQPMVLDQISELIDKDSSGYYKGGDPTLDSKMNGFGMIFSYEFTVLPYLVLAVDAGFVNSSLEMNVEGGGGNVSLRYGLVPYSFGIKFFTGRNAPWGFYLYPKIGGTVFNATVKYDLDAEKITGQTAPPGTGDTTKNETYNLSSHGVYASLEIGWRIQLFPKMGKDWPVQIGIDIALFDIGYYFVPWAPADGLSSAGLTIPDEYTPLANIRFLPMPKLGITIRF